MRNQNPLNWNHANKSQTTIDKNKKLNSEKPKVKDQHYQIIHAQLHITRNKHTTHTSTHMQIQYEKTKIKSFENSN